MGPPLGCRCRLAACALGSREILKRESRQSADQCVRVTILPIEHPEWNTRFASILVSTGGSAKDQRCHKTQVPTPLRHLIRRHSTMQGQRQRRDTEGACGGDHPGHARRAPRPGTDRGRHLPRPQPDENLQRVFAGQVAEPGPEYQALMPEASDPETRARLPEAPEGVRRPSPGPLAPAADRSAPTTGCCTSKSPQRHPRARGLARPGLQA
jgi:hypothetical protein